MTARLVRLAVKPAYALTLDTWFPTMLSRPLRSSVTFWEETAPVKLPSMHGPPPSFMGIGVRPQTCSGWYFKVGSTPTEIEVSKPPTYPTQNKAMTNTSLQ